MLPAVSILSCAPTKYSERTEHLTVGSSLTLRNEKLKVVGIEKNEGWIDLRSPYRNVNIRLKNGDDYGEGMGERIRLKLIDIRDGVAIVEISQSSGGYMFP
jgi:hypothetical protein